MASELDRIIRELVDLRAQLPAPPSASAPRSHDFLDTNTLAKRLELNRATIAKRCQLGLARRHPGVRKPEGRWEATVEAMRDLG